MMAMTIARTVREKTRNQQALPSWSASRNFDANEEAWLEKCFSLFS